MTKLPLWVRKRGGLDFECTQCGACCTGAPGYVWMTEPEIERLAAHLGLDRDAFGARYLRLVWGKLSLVEKRDGSGDCAFFERGKGCTVYAARPTQCRTYPFWPEVIATRDAWRAEFAKCPGVRAGGRRFTPEEIERLLDGEGETSAPAAGEKAP
jgi:Fe-S-cluster containining protein